MLSVDDFRRKYPNSTEEQVALYGAAVAAELANPPKPEPDLPMPRITVPAPMTRSAASQMPSTTSPYQMTPPNRGVIWYGNLIDAPLPSPAPDLTTDIRRIVLSRRLTPAERAQAERPDMSGDDLLALLAGVPNAREWEVLEGD